MRVLWGLGFALVVVLGFVFGFRNCGEAEGRETAGFLDDSAVSTEPPPVRNAGIAGLPPATPPAIAPAPAKVVATAPAPAPAPVKPAGARPEEASLASSVLHRPWSEVSVLVSQSELSDARKRMYAAVSAAVGGDLERAKQFGQGLEKSDELDGRERALLASALQGSNAAPVAAASTGDSVGALAMALTLRARDAAKFLASGRHAEAARAYSDVLVADATAEWPADRTALQRWSEGILIAQEGHRWNKQGTWPSINVTVKAGDSLTTIRQRVIKEHPELVICTGLIQRSNQLRNERDLHPGDVLRIPTEPVHMLVDISTRWVLYMIGDEVVAAWEGGVGKPGSDTVPGEYRIGTKLKDPRWFRPGAPSVPFGDPENPLGTRWMSWQREGAESSLGFHGTTDPHTVGGAVSAGCVRLRNEDVEKLYEILPEKSRVRVQP